MSGAERYEVVKLAGDAFSVKTYEMAKTEGDQPVEIFKGSHNISAATAVSRLIDARRKLENAALLAKAISAAVKKAAAEEAAALEKEADKGE